jgi:excisionase family DNA binding protein
MPGNSPLLKVQEVAIHFSVTNRTVLDWIRRGRLTGVRLASGHWRVVGASFQSLLCPPKVPTARNRTADGVFVKNARPVRGKK